MVRSYAPYDRKKDANRGASKKERKERSSTEWDIRIDCDKNYAEEIVNNLKSATGILDYVLVSGIEKADSEQLNNSAKENHVHIALVSKYPLRRDQALSNCRGFLKKTDEYAMPRNRKFTYAGWFMHHTKIDWKLLSEQSIRYEYGLLPADPMDEDTKKAVVRMYNKFGKDSTQVEEENRRRFSKWLE